MGNRNSNLIDKKKKLPPTYNEIMKISSVIETNEISTDFIEQYCLKKLLNVM